MPWPAAAGRRSPGAATVSACSTMDSGTSPSHAVAQLDQDVVLLDARASASPSAQSATPRCARACPRRTRSPSSSLAHSSVTSGVTFFFTTLQVTSKVTGLPACPARSTAVSSSGTSSVNSFGLALLHAEDLLVEGLGEHAGARAVQAGLARQRGDLVAVGVGGLHGEVGVVLRLASWWRRKRPRSRCSARPWPRPARRSRHRWPRRRHLDGHGLVAGKLHLGAQLDGEGVLVGLAGLHDLVGLHDSGRPHGARLGLVDRGRPRAVQQLLGDGADEPPRRPARCR